MTKEQLYKSIRFSKRLGIAKKKIEKGFDINWETDINKIDFMPLRDRPTFINNNLQNYNLKIENKVIESIFTLPENLTISSIFADSLYVELIELCTDSDKKIIPPIIMHQFDIKDGLRVSTGRLIDGNHRARISYLNGLREIPMIIGEQINEYAFTGDKWNFYFDGDILNIKEINGDKEYVFTENNWIKGGYDYGENVFRLPYSYHLKKNVEKNQEC